MTDVTGFGLLGHLVEMCEGAGLEAQVDVQRVPLLAEGRLRDYHEKGCVPGGSKRNWASYGHHVNALEGFYRDVLCDPQTSGGLLVSVDPKSADAVEQLLRSQGVSAIAFGEMHAARKQSHLITAVD
jgi:selenide,water dikinase